MANANLSYKELHEQFVSDHTGTTSTDVSVVLSAVGIEVFIRVCVQIVLGKSEPRSIWYTLCVDHIFLVLPLQLILTVWSEHVVLSLVSLLSLGLMGIVLKFKFQSHKTKWLTWGNISNKNIAPALSFISNFRAYVLVYTAISILGVDFAIFPRRYCKAETYGTGVMDTGVGLFVISNAIVSPEARVKVKNRGFQSLVRCLVSCLPLVVLGMLRVIVTKEANYQEHVTEYGVHWNFFFTLAAVKILSTLFYICVPEFLWNLCAVVVTVGYQYSLDAGGVKNYILLGADGHGGRDGFINANREGVFSCLGYFALYVFGTEMGKMFFRYERVTLSSLRSLLIALSFLSLCFWAMYNLVLVVYGEPVSRRLANLTYIVWILALSSQTLAVLLLVDLFVEYLRLSAAVTVQTLPTKGLLNAVNYNGLFYFLLSNVLTGLVNISVQTIHTPPLTSSLILSLYMFLMSGVSVLLFTKKVRLKFW